MIDHWKHLVRKAVRSVCEHHQGEAERSSTRARSRWLTLYGGIPRPKVHVHA